MNVRWRATLVPRALITNANLSVNARHLYMALTTHTSKGMSTCQLTLNEMAATSGITSPKGLRRFVKELIRHGWVKVARQPGPTPSQYTLQTSLDAVAVPVYLIHHPKLRPAAKCLYALLLTLTRTAGTPVAIRQNELTQRLGLADTTLSRHVTFLNRAGWLHITRKVREPTMYVVLDPHLAAREDVLRRVKIRARRAPKGESIMKELLNALVVDSVRCQDNARPDFLVNPVTDERLEFDRWYQAAHVAFEFNGLQHEQTTSLVPDLNEVRAQRARDMFKAAIAHEKGIALIAVRPADLSFERITELIDGRLPLHDLHGDDDPVIQFLDRESRTYVYQWA